MSFLDKLKDNPWEKVKLWKNHLQTRSHVTNSTYISTTGTSEPSVYDASGDEEEHAESNVDIIMKTLKRDVSKLLKKCESKSSVINVLEKVDCLENCIRSICNIQDGIIKHPCVRDELLQEHKDMIVSLVREITDDLNKHWTKVRKEKKSMLDHNKRGIDSVLELLKDEVVKMVDILVARKSFYPCTIQNDKYSTPSFSFLKEESSIQTDLIKKDTTGSKPNKCASEPVIPKSTEQTKSKEVLVAKKVCTSYTKFADGIPGNITIGSYVSGRKDKVDPSSNFALYERNISKMKKKSSNIIDMRKRHLADQESVIYAPSNTSTALYTLAQSSVTPFHSISRLVLDSSRRIGVNFAEIDRAEFSEDTYWSCLQMKDSPVKGLHWDRAKTPMESRKGTDMKDPPWKADTPVLEAHVARRSRSCVREARSCQSTEALTRISATPYRTIALKTDSLLSFSRPTISNVSVASSVSPAPLIRPVLTPAPASSQPVLMDSRFSTLYLSGASVSPLYRNKEDAYARDNFNT